MRQYSTWKEGVVGALYLPNVKRAAEEKGCVDRAYREARAEDRSGHCGSRSVREEPEAQRDADGFPFRGSSSGLVSVAI